MIEFRTRDLTNESGITHAVLYIWAARAPSISVMWWHGKWRMWIINFQLIFLVSIWFAVARETGCQLQTRDKSWRRWRRDATSRVFIVTYTIHRDYPPGSLHFLFTILQNTVNILFHFLQNARDWIECYRVVGSLCTEWYFRSLRAL